MFFICWLSKRDPESSINNTKSNVCGKCFDMNFQKSQNCNDVALKEKLLKIYHIMLIIYSLLEI